MTDKIKQNQLQYIQQNNIKQQRQTKSEECQNYNVQISQHNNHYINRQQLQKQRKLGDIAQVQYNQYRINVRKQSSQNSSIKVEDNSQNQNKILENNNQVNKNEDNLSILQQNIKNESVRQPKERKSSIKLQNKNQQQRNNQIIHQYSINMQNINKNQFMNANHQTSQSQAQINNQILQQNKKNDKTLNLMTSAILNSFIDLKNILKHHIIYLFLPKSYLPNHNNLYYKYGYQSYAILSDAQKLQDATKGAKKYHIPFLYIQVLNQKQETLVRQNILKCFQIAQFLNQNYYVFAEAITFKTKTKNKQRKIIPNNKIQMKEDLENNDKKDAKNSRLSANTMDEQQQDQQNWEDINEQQQLYKNKNKFLEQNINQIEQNERYGYLYFYQNSTIYTKLLINQENLKEQFLTAKLQQNRSTFYTNQGKRYQKQRKDSQINNNISQILSTSQRKLINEVSTQKPPLKQISEKTLPQVSQFIQKLQQNQ